MLLSFNAKSGMFTCDFPFEVSIRDIPKFIERTPDPIGLQMY